MQTVGISVGDLGDNLQSVDVGTGSMGYSFIS